MTDPDRKFSQGLEWTAGDRLARYAMILDKGKVVYAEKEPGRDVTVRSLPITSNFWNILCFRESSYANDQKQVSSAEAVLAKL
jgi:hypothetical protein